jgi:hypothetical protein
MGERNQTIAGVPRINRTYARNAGQMENTGSNDWSWSAWLSVRRCLIAEGASLAQEQLGKVPTGRTRP